MQVSKLFYFTLHDPGSAQIDCSIFATASLNHMLRMEKLVRDRGEEATIKCGRRSRC